MRDVGSMNVSQIQSVQTPWHAEMRNVLIHALSAQSMLTAQLVTTKHAANAGLAIKATHTAPSVPRVSKFPEFCNFPKPFGQILMVLLFFCLFNTVPVRQPDCLEDKDCPSRQSCLQEKCKNPCDAITPCVTNAKCTVHNSLPLRTMSCTCLPGYTGKGDENCIKIRKLPFCFKIRAESNSASLLTIFPFCFC